MVKSATVSDSPSKKRKTTESDPEVIEVESGDGSKNTYAAVAGGPPVIPAMLANGQFPGIRQIQPPGTPSQPRQRKQSIMYGKAKTGKDGEEELLAADVALVASGVSKDATAEQLKEFIGRKGIHVVEIEKLTKDDAETRTNTFKVLIKTADYEKAMDPEVWPYRVGIRHFKPQRRSRQGMSWEQQTQQNGGHVNQHPNRRPGPGPGGRYRQQSQQEKPFNLDVQNRYMILTDGNGDAVHYN